MALACSGVSGAPRPMKMGNTRSPWRYDNDAENIIEATFMRCGRPSFSACQRTFAGTSEGRCSEPTLFKVN